MEVNNSKITQKVISKNHLANPLNITRYASGIVNDVYDLDNYVLKIEGENPWARGILNHQKEILDKLIVAGAKVPKAIDYGIIEDKPYLLMGKMKGNNLVYNWMKFSIKEREIFIAQTAEQLRIFHSIKFDDYCIELHSKRYTPKLKEAIKGVTDFNLVEKAELKEEYREDLEFLEEFYHSHEGIIEEAKTAVLVHNDIHLENIFYEGDTITGIIDFDWACQAPKDYELWKLSDVFYDPKKTVEEKLEPLYEGYRMTEEFGFLKKHYPELFQVPNLLTRVRLFSLGN